MILQTALNNEVSVLNERSINESNLSDLNELKIQFDNVKNELANTKLESQKFSKAAKDFDRIKIELSISRDECHRLSQAAQDRELIITQLAYAKVEYQKLQQAVQDDQRTKADERDAILQTKASVQVAEKRLRQEREALDEDKKRFATYEASMRKRWLTVLTSTLRSRALLRSRKARSTKSNPKVETEQDQRGGSQPLLAEPAYITVKAYEIATQCLLPSDAVMEETGLEKFAEEFSELRIADDEWDGIPQQAQLLNSVHLLDENGSAFLTTAEWEKIPQGTQATNFVHVLDEIEHPNPSRLGDQYDVSMVDTPPRIGSTVVVASVLSKKRRSSEDDEESTIKKVRTESGSPQSTSWNSQSPFISTSPGNKQPFEDSVAIREVTETVTVTTTPSAETVLLPTPILASTSPSATSSSVPSMVLPAVPSKAECDLPPQSSFTVAPAPDLPRSKTNVRPPSGFTFTFRRSHNPKPDEDTEEARSRLKELVASKLVTLVSLLKQCQQCGESYTVLGKQVDDVQPLTDEEAKTIKSIGTKLHFMGALYVSIMSALSRKPWARKSYQKNFPEGLPCREKKDFELLITTLEQARTDVAPLITYSESWYIAGKFLQDNENWD